jgi:hypothetical protein
VSEGIDFSDARGRAVVITGLPFAPKDDPKLVLKQNYLDLAKREGFAEVDRAENDVKKAKALGNAAARVLTEATLRLVMLKKDVDNKPSGSSWYNQQAHRSVNQAMGRVIRHKDDWGAVLLLDERFSTETKSLCAWLRRFVTTNTELAPFMGSISTFFRNAKHKYGAGIGRKVISVEDPSMFEQQQQQSNFLSSEGGGDNNDYKMTSGPINDNIWGQTSSSSSFSRQPHSTLSAADAKQSAHERARQAVLQLQREHAKDAKERNEDEYKAYMNEKDESADIDKEPRSLSSILQTKALTKIAGETSGHSRPFMNDSSSKPPPTKIQKLTGSLSEKPVSSATSSSTSSITVPPLESSIPLQGLAFNHLNSPSSSSSSASSSSSSSSSSSNSKVFLSSLKAFLGVGPFTAFYNRLSEEKKSMKAGEKLPRNKITQLMEMLSSSLTIAVKTFLQSSQSIPLQNSSASSSSSSSSSRDVINSAKISEAEALLRRFALFFPSAESFAQQEVEAFANRFQAEVNR